MQATLFEAPEMPSGGGPSRSTPNSSQANPLPKAHLEEVSGRVGDNGRGVVAIRSSRSAICGDQSSEFWIRDGLVPISFADLVKESSGHLVLPVDPCSKEDALLLKDITQALTAFVRVSEKSFEYNIAEAIRKTALEVSVLGRPGYPDCQIRQGERTTYLEIKASASVQKPSTAWLKTFSFSSGKKIKSDARHLLLKVQLEEEDNKIWNVLSWELRDLSTLKLRLRTLFDAGFSELEQVRLLGSSKLSAQSLIMSGRSRLDEPKPVIMRPGRRRCRAPAGYRLG